MKKFISQNPIASFIFFSFLYSWSLWLLMILSNKGLLPFRFPTNFLGSFGPAVGAIVVTSITSGRSGFKVLMSKLLSFRAGLVQYLFALLFIVVALAVSVFVYHLVSGASIEFSKITSWPEFFIYIIIIFFLGGPFGEEIGWRGFLQPQLHKRFNHFVASLLIFIVWFAWHIPLFWLEGAAQQGDSLINFGVMVLCMSFLFTWLYIKTKGSLMLALLFHTSINFVSAYVAPMVLPALNSNKQHDLISTLTIVGLTAIVVLTSWKVFTQKSDF